jgi:L,D-peptidoglycan transpeptidase YkuD (ErfK/YbiS/YcfS/YnhG family)
MKKTIIQMLVKKHKIIICYSDGTQEKIRCTVGRNGIISADEKREGDSSTPDGIYQIIGIFYRQNRIQIPQTNIFTKSINENDAWCTDPDSELYNQPIKLPFENSCEKLYKKDNSYDIIVILNYNTKLCIKNKGSAIFLTSTTGTLKKTLGSISIKKSILLKIIPMLTNETNIVIKQGAPKQRIKHLPTKQDFKIVINSHQI